ncbi:MAG TPA: hypothetical protein VFW13_10485, partial [Phenylobacterium sp.]|nr:hypothetical protein [Phenylobacterium sp.]
RRPLQAAGDQRLRSRAMTIQQCAALISIACSMLAIMATGWLIWQVNYVHRKRGRREVERTLAGRGETLVALKDVPFFSPLPKTGLSANVIFEVRARTAAGDERTYQWAYQPRLFPWESEGLKRLAHGIWIPA